MDEELSQRSVLVVLVLDANAVPSLQGVPEWRAQQKILWAEALRRVGGGSTSSRSENSLPMGGTARRYYVDFLSTADVGRLVLAEEDAESEVSEWERRIAAGFPIVCPAR